jgi:hypothetical protein
MYRLELDVYKKFNRLMMMVHGVSQEFVTRAARFMGRPVDVRACDVELLDSISHDEGLLVCAYLEKRGFRAGRDFGVYRCGSLYGLAIKRDCCAKTSSLIRETRRAGVVCAIASNILKNWRNSFGRRLGDVYEAVNAAYKVSKVRDKLFSSKCPNCGGQGVMAKEYVQGENYIIFVKRVCCDRRRRVEIPLKPNGPA